MSMDTTHFPNGLSIRPVLAKDSGFIESLYRSTRSDLRLINAENDFVESLIEQQFYAQTIGYGSMYPDAMYFIIEKLGEAIGRVILDFGNNEVLIVDLAFIPAARGKGFGRCVIQGLQATAARVQAPLTLSVHPANLSAKRLYLDLGFRVDQRTPMSERMAWHPTLAAHGALA